MKQNNLTNIIAASTVMNTTLTSLAIQLFDAFSFSIRVSFTGTPTGTFILQASNDKAYSGLPNAGGSGLNAPAQNWSTVANSLFTVTAAGDVMYDYYGPGFNWVRVQYTDTSGGSSTAVIATATFNGKSF